MCTTACAAHCTQAICGASTALSPSAELNRRAASSTRRSARAEGSIIRRCVRVDGLPSLTEYETLQVSGRFTLLRLHPQTGRTHQLRVHMAYLGHPLAGDWLYGTEDKTLIARPALHSYELWFTQPVTGQELHFTAPIPQDMQRLME